MHYPKKSLSELICFVNEVQCHLGTNGNTLIVVIVMSWEYETAPFSSVYH